MSVPVWLRWTLLALLGLAVAAGVSVAASHLVSQRIGLASEPLSAGRALAPPPREQAGPSRAEHSREAHQATTTTTTTATTTTTPTVQAPPSTPSASPPSAPGSGNPPTTAPAPPSGGGGEREGGDD